MKLIGQAGPDGRPETIRQWYKRTTDRWRRALFFATLAAIAAGAVVYMLASFHLLARLQTFNGALTIPISALIWILSFVYVFLVPSREVGFRSQESLEKSVELLEDAVEKKIAPAVEIWRKLGERVEKEFDAGFMDDFKSAVRELREAAAKIQASAENSNGELKRFTEDAKPALDALKRIQGRIENEFGTGFIEDLRVAVSGMKNMAAPPANPTEPNLDRALKVVMKKPAPKAAPQAEPASRALPLTVETQKPNNGNG